MCRSSLLTLSILASILVWLVAPLTLTVNADMVSASIRWVRYIIPIEVYNYSYAYGVCIFGDYIAVVGYYLDVGQVVIPTTKPYVALLNKSDGSIVKEWIGSEEGNLFNCISIGGKLYVVGSTEVENVLHGLFYVFDENLNPLAKVIGKKSSFYNSLTYNGKVLYLVGVVSRDVNGDGYSEDVWLIEKRDPETLSLIASREVYFESWSIGQAYDVGVEPSTGRIWTVGGYADANSFHTLIVILDSNLNIVKVIDYPEESERYLDWIYGIAFDSKGYAYVSALYGIAKLSSDGELVAINRYGQRGFKIAYKYGYVYIFGDDKIGDYWRHILSIYDTNLNLVGRYLLSGNVDADSRLDRGRPAVEGNRIYVAGYDYALGDYNSRIVVYAIELSSVSTVTQSTQTGISTSPTVPMSATKPSWVTEGKYAEYEIFLESNVSNVSSRIGTARIEVKAVSSLGAIVEVSVDIDQQGTSALQSILGGAFNESIPTAGTHIWTYQSDLYPFLLGSKSLEEMSKGQWSDQLFTLLTEPKRVAVGTFDCYKLSASISVSEEGASVSFNVSYWYEKSTGLLVAYEWSVQFLNESARLSVQLKSTNILGEYTPSRQDTSLLGVIGFVIVIIAIVAVAVLILHKYRRVASAQLQSKTRQQIVVTAVIVTLLGAIWGFIYYALDLSRYDKVVNSIFAIIVVLISIWTAERIIREKGAGEGA